MICITGVSWLFVAFLNAYFVQLDQFHWNMNPLFDKVIESWSNEVLKHLFHDSALSEWTVEAFGTLTQVM